MAYRDTQKAEHEVHTSHHGHYAIVFVALLIFTLISVIADIIHIPSEALKTVIVMAVAVAKGSCVMLFFMHLKFERKWKFVLLAPTITLAIGLPIALMPDIAEHYYISDVPQIADYDEAMSSMIVDEDEGGEHSADAGENESADPDGH